MAVNKVVYNRRTLIDLTADTVSKETLKKGFTAHQADGTMITGEFIGDDYDEIDRQMAINIFRTMAQSSAQSIHRVGLWSRPFQMTS